MRTAIRILVLLPSATILLSCDNRAAVLLDGSSPHDGPRTTDGRRVGDGAARRCGSTADCLWNEFCQLDQLCRQREGRTAVCLPRPSACPDAYMPVCGCDGTTYGNACDAHSAGVSVAADGPCNQQACGDLDRGYQAAVQQAKTCCAQCKSIQCTLKVKTELACPCQTYVDPSNAGPLATMDSLEQQWNGLKCGPVPCPAIACPDPKGATCVPASGGNGACQDLTF